MDSTWEPPQDVLRPLLPFRRRILPPRKIRSRCLARPRRPMRTPRSTPFPCSYPPPPYHPPKNPIRRIPAGFLAHHWRINPALLQYPVSPAPNSTTKINVIARNLSGFRSNLRSAGIPSRPCPIPPYFHPPPIILHVEAVSFRRPLTNLSIVFWKLVSTRMWN